MPVEGGKATRKEAAEIKPGQGGPLPCLHLTPLYCALPGASPQPRASGCSHTAFPALPTLSVSVPAVPSARSTLPHTVAAALTHSHCLTDVSFKVKTAILSQL